MPKSLKAQTPKFSADALQRTSTSLVENAIMLYPNVPASHIVPGIIEMAEPDFLLALDGSLRVGYFLRLTRTIRLKQKRREQENAWLFPELRALAMALPPRIPIGEGATVSRNEMRYEHTVRYLKVLDREERQKKDRNARRIAIIAIQKLWPRAKKRPRQMTLAEVDALKAENA